MNLQYKEKIGKISHILKALGPKVKIRLYKRDLVQKWLDKSVFQIHKIINENHSSAIYFFHEENIAPNNTKIPCSEFCAGSFSHHCYQMMQLN